MLLFRQVETPGFFVVAIGAVPAAALAAVTAFAQVLFGEHHVPFVGVIKIAFFNRNAFFEIAHGYKVQHFRRNTLHSCFSLFCMLPLLPPRLQTFRRNGREFTMLRLDEVHPFAGGNKLFKLKYNLEAARSAGHDTLLTFGGAFSNHIAATAAAAKETGFKSIGIIRGEASALQNSTLQFAAAQGMQFHFLDRGTYRLKDTPVVIAELHNLFGRFYLVPEGGANTAGARGCAEIPALSGTDFTHIALACGTGTTLAGIASAVQPGVQVIGFPVLKNGQFLEAAIETHLRALNADAEPVPNWSLQCDYHFGGYAKVPESLRTFKTAFETETGIPLDYVYTAKMVYGVCDLGVRGYFPADARVLLIHTGGLQGNAGFDYKQ